MERRRADGVLRSSSQQQCRRRDEHDEFNNNVTASAAGINNGNCSTTVLVDELEQLRIDNFQLRLRVYNAERRVDRLSAAARRRDKRRDGDSDASGTTTDDDDDDDDDADDAATTTNARAAAATAEAAVRTIHDLLTVNRRLLALLATAVSAKAVAVTADDKRRWRQLRDHIDDTAAGADDGSRDERNGQDDDDDGEPDASATTGFESRTTGVGTSAGRQRALPSPLPSPPLPPTPPPETSPADDGSELSRLRARCRRLERSLQQLVNTELWARNRQIGRLEQQRCVTQQQQQQQQRVAADAERRQRCSRPTTSPTKGILVIRSPAKTQPAAAVTTPPPVLPDYSEVNFFSCDEDGDRCDSQTNTWSSADEQTDESDGDASVRRADVAPADEPSAPRKRPCRRDRGRLRRSEAVAGAAASSSAESAAGGRTSGGGGGGGGRLARRRYGRCRTCAETAVTDAQVQCGPDSGVGGGDDDEQVSLLRRELDGRRRENRRLYEMLLRLQREHDDGNGPGAGSPPHDRDVDSDPDRADSPEPYRRAARAVRGRIADLLPPLLSMRPAADAPTTAAGTEADRKLSLLARLRERVVAYERQELYGDGGGETTAAATEEQAVRRMDRAALVNVALPRAVDRLRRALIPLLRPEEERTIDQ